MVHFRHLILATLLYRSVAFADQPVAQLGGAAGSAMQSYRAAYDELQKVGVTNKLYFCVYQKTSYTITPGQAADQVNPAEIAKRINNMRAVGVGMPTEANPNQENAPTPSNLTANFAGMVSSTMYTAMRETLEYTKQIRYKSSEHTAEECATGQATMESAPLNVASANYDCTTDLPKLSAQLKTDAGKYGRLSTCFTHLVTRVEYVEKRFHKAFDGQTFMDSGTCAGTTAARDTVGKDLETQRKSLAAIAQADSDKSKSLSDHAAQLDAALKTCNTAGAGTALGTTTATRTSSVTGP